MNRKPLVALAVTLGVCLSLSACGDSVLAKGVPAYTAQALADRAQIEDLLTRYYWNFGGSSAESFTAFYADDAELVLGSKSYKGLKAIEGAYAAVPADVPQRHSFSFNVLIGNPLITLHGDTANARLVYTEYVIEKEGDPPKLLTQGREFDHLVRQHGKWLLARRQIMPANGVPDGWED